MSGKDQNENREYIAFISYRHKDLDKYVAKKVHTLIERYVVPKELRKKDEASGTEEAGKNKTGRKLGLVFRDEEELPVSSNLTESIQTALDHTEFLIVICTPNTPESIWVEREIAYFLTKHDRTHVIGVLADGTPDESFPKLLTTIYAEDGVTPVGVVEPMAANLTDNSHHFDKRRFGKEAVRLYAALIGCPFDYLWQRDRRYKMRCGLAVMALVLTVALAFCVSIYLKNLQIMERNRQIEDQNEQIQAQNTEIKDQYREIQEKNSELRKSEAEILIREGGLLYEKGDMTLAAARASAAVSTQEGHDLFAPDAEYLLKRALGAGSYDNVMRTVDVLEQPGPIQNILISQDKEYLYTLDESGYARCFSVKDGELLWTGDSLSKNYHGYVAERQRLQEIPESGLLLCCNEDSIAALHSSDGSLAWNYRQGSGEKTDFACFSRDQKKLAVITAEGVFQSQSSLVLLDTKNGGILQELSMEEAFGENRLRADGNICGAFSEDGRYLFGMVYEDEDFFAPQALTLFMADLQEGSVKKIYTKPVVDQIKLIYPFVIGIQPHPETESVIALYYDRDAESVCMDEIFWDGSVGEQSSVSVSMPAKDLSEPYVSTFVPAKENGALLASCGETVLIYRERDGALISSKKYADSNILAVSWMDEENYTRSMLSDDGKLYGMYEAAGVSIAPFFDKIHIVKAAVSEGFVTNHGDYGLTLVSDAVAAVVCDDDKRKLYLQKPDKDTGLREASWCKDVDQADLMNGYLLFDLDDRTLGLVMQPEKDLYHVKFVDASSQQTIAEYQVDASALADLSSGIWLMKGVFWDDRRHVTVPMMNMGLGILDLETCELRQLFDGERVYGDGVKKLHDGKILQATICRNDYKDYTCSLLVGIDDAKSQRIENTGGKYWMEPLLYRYGALVRIGGNGYILIGQYAQQQESNTDEIPMESFYFYDAKSGLSGEIPDECPGTADRIMAMGEVSPLFATADQDDCLRIYDMEKKTVKTKIPLPVKLKEVEDILFCREDTVAAVWTMDRKIYLYDIKSGELLLHEEVEKEDSSTVLEIGITCIDDPDRNRLYFKTSGDAVICIDTKYWVKTGDFKGMDAFCRETNEIYWMKYLVLTFREEKDGVLYGKAYTLDELKEMATR